MLAAVGPVLVPGRIHVGASMSFRSLFGLPPFLSRILPVSRRNVRFFLVRVLHGNLRGCRSFNVGCYRKDGNIVRRADAAGHAVDYRLVSGSRGSIGVAVHLRGVYNRTPLVMSQFVLVSPSSVRELRHCGVSLDLIEVITIREIHPLVRG